MTPTMTPPPTAPASSPSLSTIYRKGLPLLTQPPLNPHSPVGKWLLGTSFLVASMVHIGGVTRLTKSGLSMTDWKPLGSRPPITEEEWMAEFERYKAFPEWQQRQSMSLDEFRYIYYWEWGHRMLGRVVGVAFAVPWAYFTFARRGTLSSPAVIPPGYQSRLALLFAMGGTQGLVGWWMVKSGLGDDRRGDKKEIRVSPYRLAAHLGMAVGTYSFLVWTGLGVLSYPVDKHANIVAKASDKGPVSMLQQWVKNLSPTALQHARRLRVGAIHTVGLTGLTILSGAFVAGNDAGNAYNTYPLMNDQLVPYDDMIDPDLVPKYRNLFENTATVQFNHRLLGTATALSALGLASFGLLHPAGRGSMSPSSSTKLASTLTSLPSTTPQVRRGLLALGTAATAQMSLGIATLLNYVPIGLAATHQLGSLVVLTCGIYTAHSLRYASGKSLGVVGKGVEKILEKGIAGGGGGYRGKASVAASKIVNFKP